MIIILPMDKDGLQNQTIQQPAVRVCPACGTVNPAGPSESCPHLQLVRFRTIDEPLSDLLERMAVVRNQFRELLLEFRMYMSSATKLGDAEIVAAHKSTKLSDIDGITQKTPQLILTYPEKTERSKSQISSKKKKKSSPPPVDSKQLSLLIHDMPKGDA